MILRALLVYRGLDERHLVVARDRPGSSDYRQCGAHRVEGRGGVGGLQVPLAGREPVVLVDREGDLPDRIDRLFLVGRSETEEGDVDAVRRRRVSALFA